jgi:hypothetical protein
MISSCRIVHKFTYEIIEEIFINNNCKIITTKNEFLEKKMTTQSKFKYIATCGHEHQIKFGHFKNSGSGRNCPACVCKNNSINMKTKENNSSEVIEYNGYSYIYNTIIDKYNIYKTFDGCKADLLIKPNNNNSNNWLLVQIKVASKKKNDHYSFSKTSGYNNYCVILIGIDNSINEYNNKYKTWIMNGNDLNNGNSITITNKRSKYKINQIDSKNLFNFLLNCYNNHNFTKIELKDEIKLYSIKSQKEQIGRVKREIMLTKILDIKYPKFEKSVYDCIINGYKVQDKTVQFSNTKRLSFSISHTVNGNKYKPYKKGDNDFYWFSNIDISIFFVIPEDELIKYGYIKTESQEGKQMISLYPHGKSQRINYMTWTLEYIFDYDNLDIPKLKNLLKTKILTDQL